MNSSSELTDATASSKKSKILSSLDQRGVLYFSSIPRDIRPHEVRLHFNRFGKILRMKFVPYPKKERRPGGPLLPLQYKEGWMEFASSQDAKFAAAAMNGNPVDCKRQRRCYGQLWMVKYLEHFYWNTLLEEQEGCRRMRRAAEVEARQAECEINEAYRRLVYSSASHSSSSATRSGGRHPKRSREDSEKGDKGIGTTKRQKKAMQKHG
ncbi:unnamed protein product [Phytomonas sp. Hart1]|nr:unnamed protein product [Phytomonas sp. Hart1]|eukprot:CCW71955.1 unnamed protein product [Phytomonas sp. isolate Hart1]